MRHQVRRRIQPEQSGFTLIELLVVIVVIAVLAAIAIPTFLSQSDKAEDSEAKTAVRTATSAAKDYFVDNETYAGMDTAELQAVEPSLNQGQGATITVVANGATGYTLTVTSKSRNDFTITEVDGVASRTCDTGGSAGCPTGGRW